MSDTPGGYGPPPGYGDPSGFHTAPRPGIIPLRPLGLGELYGGAFAYLRQNPGSTLVPAFLVAAVLQAVQLLLEVALGVGGQPTSLREIPAFLGRSVAASGVSGLLSLLLSAALTAVLVAVLRGALIGRRTSFGEAWQASGRRVPGLVGLSLLIAVAVLFVAIVGYGAAVGLGVAVRGAGGVLIGVLLGLAVTALIVYLGVVWSLSATAYVIEDVGVTAALGRSAQLVRGQWWRIFGVLLLAALVVGVVIGVISFVTGAASVAPDLSAGTRAVVTPSPVVQIVSAVLGVVVGTVVTPFFSGLAGLLYVDQRIRRERFDLQLAVLAAQPPPAPR